MQKERIASVLQLITGQTMGVVGDFMLDEYLWGDVCRISPEAPVPVVQVQERSFRLGGAANVAHNLRTLGLQTHCFGILGRDHHGARLKAMMKKNGMRITGLVQVPGRTTTLKSRIIAGHQQVVRVDQECSLDMGRALEARFIKTIRAFLSRSGVSGMIVSDYHKGVVTPGLTSWLCDECRRQEVYVAVDPKKMDFGIYKGANLVTPNFQELEKASHCELTDKAKLESHVRRLIKTHSFGAILVTMGARGMALFRRGQEAIYMDTVTRSVFDVTGAGDTVISVFVAALAAGAQDREAMMIANHAAGIVIREIGTVAVKPGQLLAEIGRTEI